MQSEEDVDIESLMLRIKLLEEENERLKDKVTSLTNSASILSKAKKPLLEIKSPQYKHKRIHEIAGEIGQGI